MASIINASSTGSGGIVQTADASGVLQLQTNGTLALTVATTARVGIGTASPNGLLHVAGNNGPLRISGGGYVIDPAEMTLGQYSSTRGYIQVPGGSTGQVEIWNGGTTGVVVFNTYGIGLSGTSPTSGMGITFSPTQSASSDANTLDDYEEGTWTTTFQTPTNLTGTPTLSGATYTKIGRLVTITGSITGYTATSSNTLTYPVFNVPFPMVSGNLSPLSGAGILSVGAIFACGTFVDNSSGDATSVALVFPAVGMTTTGVVGSITFTLVYQTS